LSYEYNNKVRSANPRSSTSANPREVFEDISSDIRELNYQHTPLLTLTSAILKRGAKPKGTKIVQREYHNWQSLDKITTATMGEDTGAPWVRYALIELAGLTRPETKASMIWQPQDKFYIHGTEDVVEVVMTPNAVNYFEDGQTKPELVPDSVAGTGVTGTAMVSACKEGCIVVKNIRPYSLKKLTNNYVEFIGHALKESQDIESIGQQFDIMYNCNFVEHQEAVVTMTEDQYTWIQTKLSKPDWDWQVEKSWQKFKNAVEMNMFFGKRSIESEGSRTKLNMNGFMNTVKTNVAYYNPWQVTDYEMMIQSFLIDKGFRYGESKKIGLIGQNLNKQFSNSFKDYRKTQGISPKDVGTSAGLNIESYLIPGGMSIGLMQANNLFKPQTPMSDWLAIIDPEQQELRVVKDFATRDYSLPTQRDKKMMIEWQGSIAFHLEQHHALLKTYNTNGFI
jgi:hypothetical protein